jgi:hypothetical protein
MKPATGQKNWMVTVDVGDYAFVKEVSKELKMPLNETLRQMVKEMKNMDRGKLRVAVEKRAAEVELDRIKKEEQRLVARKKELQAAIGGQ